MGRLSIYEVPGSVQAPADTCRKLVTGPAGSCTHNICMYYITCGRRQTTVSSPHTRACPSDCEGEIGSAVRGGGKLTGRIRRATPALPSRQTGGQMKTSVLREPMELPKQRKKRPLQRSWIFIPLLILSPFTTTACSCQSNTVSYHPVFSTSAAPQAVASAVIARRPCPGLHHSHCCCCRRCRVGRWPCLRVRHAGHHETFPTAAVDQP